MSVMTSLPTSTGICQSLSKGDAEVHKSLMQLLTFATDTSDGGDLNAKTKEASNVLVEAWENCIDLEDNLVDVLWLKSCMLSAIPDGEEKGTGPSDYRRRSQEALGDVIKALVKVPGRRSFCTKLQSNLLPYFLDAADLTSEEDLLKRLRIHNTQVHYKQQKYNLMQEESEGYAKLIQFLSVASCGDAEQVATTRQLIGTFELDPNRVMDLAVDVLESTLYPEFIEKEHAFTQPDCNEAVIRLLGLIRHLAVEQLPSVLCFKLAAPGTSSQSLFRVVALLVAEGILNFSVMLKEYSAPIEDEINEAHKIQWMMEKKRIQALTRVSLSGATKEDPKLTELKERFQKELLRLSSSPIIHILWILLQWGKWEELEGLMSSQSWEKLCCLLPEKFGFAFCDLAQKTLDPWLEGRIATPGLSMSFETVRTQATTGEHTVDDVVQDVSKFLVPTLHSGCIQHRPVLYCQLCRVMRSLLEGAVSVQVPSDDTYQFFKIFMVPSLSLFGANPSISSELWAVLTRVPYSTRYRLYEDWKGKGLERMGLGDSPLSGKPLSVVESEINAGKAARYALKRLSKDNIRDMSRLLAKATHSAPLVVYGTILSQIESYDNMVDVMVEAQRFSNPLGLDVLGFCILSRLSGTAGGVNRNRLKEDGVNVSQWMQSLEAFSGAFFKRFPWIEFRGILFYLMRRLRAGQVMELGILASLLKVAGGYGFADYSPAASLSVAQLEGRAGSFALKRETMTFGIVEDINLRATDTIKKVLQSDGLGVSMLVLIAQARSRIVFEAARGPPKPVKLIGNLVDTCQIVISILLEFLTTEERDGDGSSTAIEEYAKYLPPLDDLHFKFGLDIESSWMLTRPLARYTRKKKETDEAQDPSLLVTETWSFCKKYESMLPEEAWAILSPELFEAFYTYALYDVFFPEDVYNSELGRLNKEIERLERPKPGVPTGTVQISAISSKDENQELERLKKVLEGLTADREKQKKQVQAMREELETKRNGLILSEVVSHEASTALLIHCIYPRSLQSPDDAMYCAHFALQLHHIKTPGFSILHYIDELVSLAAGSLYGVTEGEAANLAIILWQTWSVINRWRYEEGLFDEEVAGKPGSFMEQNTEEGLSEEREISHKDFIILYNSWHAALGTALVGCIESKEYMHTRSGLVVLTRLVDVFPTRPKLGNFFLSSLEPLQDDNSDRPDIRAAANAYSTMLLKARDDGKWKEEDASVAQARADKEKVAAEERKKKLEEQFEELQRDNEKITEEIGPERRREGRGFGARVPGAPDRGGRGGGPPHELRDARDRRSSPPRDVDRPRRDRDGDRGVERGPPSRGGDRRGGDRGGRREGLEEGRWARGEPAPPVDDRGGRGSKRGRGPSPDGGIDDRGASKRSRLEPDTTFEPRRDSGRGLSPPSRRDRGGPDASRSSRQGRRR